MGCVKANRTPRVKDQKYRTSTFNRIQEVETTCIYRVPARLESNTGISGWFGPCAASLARNALRWKPSACSAWPEKTMDDVDESDIVAWKTKTYYTASHVRFNTAEITYNAVKKSRVKETLLSLHPRRITAPPLPSYSQPYG